MPEPATGPTNHNAVSKLPYQLRKNKIMNAKPKFVYVTYIDTTPEKLWRALTTTDLIRQYWAGRINKSEWKKGAILESRSPEGELEWHGKILECKPPLRLCYTFDVVGSKEGPSRVLFEIEPPKRTGDHQIHAVKLTVTHDKFPEGSQDYRGVQQGWPTVLSSLKSLLETGNAIRFVFDR
jgi:uncharacterized protein YndB with AHSA1/START domain